MENIFMNTQHILICLFIFGLRVEAAADENFIFYDDGKLRQI